MDHEPMQDGTVGLRERIGRGWSALPSFFFPLLALLLLGGVTAGMSSTFLEPGNLVNVLREMAPIGIISLGMTFVVICGGIDLSVASLLVLSGGVGIMTLNAVVDPSVEPAAGAWLHRLLAGAAEATGLEGRVAAAVVLAFVAMAFVGLVGGWINGVIVAKGRVAAFIATLGGLLAYRSLAKTLAEGANFTGASESRRAFTALGRGELNLWLGAWVEVPYAVLIFFLLAVVAAVVLRTTRFGRYVYAVGANERAAVYSGLRTDRVKIACYTIIGGLAGVAAMIEASRSNTISSSNTASLWELDAIAAVVIGGTRLSGGRGSILGTVIGVLILGVLRNMLRLLDVPVHVQAFVQGVIIVAAVLLQRGGQRRV